MSKHFFLLIFSFIPIVFYCQNIKIEGIIKQPKNETIRAYIVVNDTINKLSKLDSTNFGRRNKITNDRKLVTVSDEKGQFTVFVSKPSDTISFRFGRLFHDEKYLASNLLKMKKIELEPKAIPCINEKVCDEEIPKKIYAFVGKKINVSYVDTSKYCDEFMDSKLMATYEIQEEFSNHYSKSTIQFIAYDHNSQYEYYFPNYDTVLIFVGEFCDDLIHIKYQFYPMFRTSSGKWATIINTNSDYYKNTNVRLQNIDFDSSISFKVPDLSEQQIEWRFPKKYFKIIDKKAYPIMGIYAEDLVKFKLEKIKKNK